MQTCTVHSCIKNAKKAGMCWAHHKKKLMFGDPLYGRENAVNATGLCTVEGCGKKYLAKGYCALHYARFKKRGEVGPLGLIDRKPVRPQCSWQGCANVSAHRGFCRKHYKANYRSSKLCSVSGCCRRHEAKNYCVFHYERFRYYGDPLAEKPKRSKRRLELGHRYVTKQGYIMVLVGKDNIHAKPNGFAWEHRLLIGQKLGRRLHDFENVHHKDGNRSNNALENLEVWATMQPSGQRPEDLVEYAKRILILYEPSSLRDANA